MKPRPADDRAAARAPISLALIVAILGATVLRPDTAAACGLSIDLRAIDARLAKADLPSEELTRARTLRAKAASLIVSGRPVEGRKAYYQLMTMLGIPTSSGRFRC